MDATAEFPSLEGLVDAITEKLTQSGELAKLGQADLETIEGEVVENMDKITCEVISKLLGKQAELTGSPQVCPKCGGSLSEKPSQSRLLQSRRGHIRFRCEVFRCEACRLDFFPSVPNTRL